MDVLISVKVRALADGGIQALQWTPRKLRGKIMLPLVMYEYSRRTSSATFLVWENKAYRGYPLLSPNDGDILRSAATAPGSTRSRTRRESEAGPAASGQVWAFLSLP